MVTNRRYRAVCSGFGTHFIFLYGNVSPLPKYVSTTFETSGDFSDEELASIQDDCDDNNDYLADYTFAFKADGTCTQTVHGRTDELIYEQDGAELRVSDQDRQYVQVMNLVGNKIIWKSAFTEDGKTVTYIYTFTLWDL